MQHSKCHLLTRLLFPCRPVCQLVLKCGEAFDLPGRGGLQRLCVRAMHPVSRALPGPSRHHVGRVETGSHHVIRQDAHQCVESGGGSHPTGALHRDSHMRPGHATQHQTGISLSRRRSQKILGIHRRSHQVSSQTPILSFDTTRRDSLPLRSIAKLDQSWNLYSQTQHWNLLIFPENYSSKVRSYTWKFSEVSFLIQVDEDFLIRKPCYVSVKILYAVIKVLKLHPFIQRPLFWPIFKQFYTFKPF